MGNKHKTNFETILKGDEVKEMQSICACSFLPTLCTSQAATMKFSVFNFLRVDDKLTTPYWFVSNNGILKKCQTWERALKWLHFKPSYHTAHLLHTCLICTFVFFSQGPFHRYQYHYDFISGLEVYYCKHRAISQNLQILQALYPKTP